MTLTQAEVVVQLAKCNMNITKTSQAMFMHRNNITYHIRQIRRDTGLNPLNFYQLCELLPKAKVIVSREE